MKLAWQFVKVNGFTMSEAMKQAWLQFKLRARMAIDVVKFTFKKVDGSIRQAYGTLADRLVPATGGNRRNNPSVQTYYDVEVADWRSYRIVNLMSVA